MKTISDINKEFNTIPCNSQVNILWVALDYMNQYNGRSRMYCVALAMGYETDDGIEFYKD